MTNADRAAVDAKDTAAHLRTMVHEIRWHQFNGGLVLLGMGEHNVRQAEKHLASLEAKNDER